MFLSIRAILLSLIIVFWISLVACSDNDATESDATDGDVADGDTTDGDTTDGDATDGDTTDGDTTDGDAPPLTRLHTEGTAIVDTDGNVVLLKGVNLGGWAYHETWITQMDYSFQSRTYQVGVEMGLEEAITDVLKEVGPIRIPGTGESRSEEEWLDELQAALALQTDNATAALWRETLMQFKPDIYDDSDKPFYIKLEERFGVEARDELIDTFMKAWIQESDIAWLAEQGFNLVRVPIGYRVLTTGSHKELPTELNWNERAFDRLNDLLDWCEAYGVYAVIDIQECPGGQNNYSGAALLYDDEKWQEMAVDLWEELSDRFIERDSVAAYSLLAEPMSAPSAEARDAVYDKLVKALRAKGDDHMLVIHDGFKTMGSLPDPADYGWENVVYSTHIFEWNTDELADYEGLMMLYEPMFDGAQEDQGVPYFIGSFSTMRDAGWAYDAAGLLVDWYNSRGWSWSLWTYKNIDNPIDAMLWDASTSWGLRGRLGSDFNRADVFQDDLDTLRAKFAAYGDLIHNPNEELLQRLKAGL